VLERLSARFQFCYVVTAYRPHRTKKGHYVWRAHREVCLFGPEGLIKSRQIGVVRGSLTNKRLTAEETIQHLADEGKAS
jgi:hypothetical protein